MATTLTNPTSAGLTTAFSNVLRFDITAPQPTTVTLADGSTVTNLQYAEQQQFIGVLGGVAAGTSTPADVLALLLDQARASTSVATLTYQFFTGKTPTAAGLDYLVHSNANANDLDDAYYAKFNTDNRYINFAVNLGTLGDGAAAFQTGYAGLSLADATAKAYTAIFGVAPTADKISAILYAPVQYGGVTHTRADYFAAYAGNNDVTSLGTKAAMVGFLLGEAEKAHLGPLALANDQYLTDIANGTASYNIDLRVAYPQGSDNPGPVDPTPGAPVDGDAAANTVAEGAAAGTHVGLTAVSSSAGGPVTYSLTADSSGGGFTIDAATGVVTVADPTKLDFESSAGAGHAYSVTVKASQAMLTASQTFSIAVTDVAPSAPVDANAAANMVAEGAAAGTAVGITASSSDVNGPAVTYSLAADSSGGGFQVNAATGVVTVADASKLNYETSGAGHAYSLTVQASDGTLTSASTFSVAVSDVAPTTPADSDAAANTVAEGAAAGTAVGVTASSSDVNGPAPTYSLTADSSGGGFKINPTTGVVTVADASKLDYETAGAAHAYSVTVQASDGTLASAQTFSIAVTNVAPTAPVDANPAANAVAEGAAAGTTVGLTAASTDPNGPSPTYSLTADSSGGGFAVNPTTGVVTVADATKLNYETSGAAHAYALTVQASDGSLTSSSTFSVAVTDVAPTAPVDADAAANTVAEGAAAGTTVGVTASSTDVNGPAPTYSLTADSSGGGFAVNPTTGVVTVADPTKLNYETSGAGHAYSLTVQASDGTLTSASTFSVAVTDVAPTAPTDANAAANTVAEGAAAGTAVGITAASTDVNGPTPTYSLTADSSGGGFAINPTTGVVTVADPTKLDYETSGAAHSYSLTVLASDGTLTSAQSFTVAVTNVAPTTPTDSNAAANTVAEGAAAGSTVGITAASSDPNGPAVTYSLTGDSSAGGFTINPTTGVVTVADPTKLDYETSGAGHAYSLVVQASDGSSASSQTFSVAVTDVAPSTPTDANVAANTVAEGAAAGTTVGITAASTDPNGPAVTYSLTGDTSGGGFAVNSSTGVVTVADATKIDYETSGAGHSYSLTVAASDGTLSSSQTFTVAVTDVAPTTPVDTNPAANTVAEGAAAGTTVGLTVSSTDPNGPTTTYSLTADSSGGGFTIDSSTGVVTVADATKLDYETSGAGHSYSLTVQATVGSTTTSQTFTVAVTDVAPSTPIDSNAAADTVTEGAANGTTVGLTASSSDVNGPAVTYSLTADSSGGGFTINASTGVVSVVDSTKIDYETASGHAYTVTAQASDGTLASSQTFTIAVTDVAPSNPVDGNAAANSVAEGAANGTTVGVTASSTDVNGPAVAWSLTGDTSGGGFTIDASTGVVTVADATKIDYETAAGHAYTVTAQASDGTLASSQTFTIAVTDVAPSTPADANAASNSVAEGAANGSTVGVTASSTDVNGPAVAYSLTADTSGGAFAVDASTGVVTVADSTKLDYESSGASHSYSITVQASDGTLTSSKTFAVAVTDVAPSTPVDSNAAANTVVEGAANGTTVGVTATSTDVNGPAVSYSLTADSSGGGFTINASTGVISVVDSTKLDYETASGHAYTVTAQASDGTLASSQTFTIGVTDVAPSTPTDSNAAANTVTESAANGSTVGLTAHATDVNGPAVTYSLTGDTSGGGFAIDGSTGVVTVADTSKITYAGSGAGHAYSLTVGASDGTLTSSQTFSVAVAPPTPTANADTASANEASGINNGTPGIEPSFNVLSNDTSPGGLALHVSSAGVGSSSTTAVTNGSPVMLTGSYGTLTIAYDGSTSYAVNNSSATVEALRTYAQTLTDTFHYTATDSSSQSSDTSITVTVHGANDTPVAVADTAVATEAGGTSNGIAGTNPVGNVLSNDTDKDSAANGEMLSVGSVQGSASNVGMGVAGTYGTLTVNAAGAYSYVVDNSNSTVEGLNTGQSLVDTFTYQVKDVAGATATSTLTVTINGADDAPVAVNDSAGNIYSGVQATTNVLTNDTDVDNSTLTAVLNTQANHGTVTLNSNGTFTYAATGGYLGADTFTYHASDGTLSSAPATVSFTVVPNVAYIDNSSASATEDGTYANPYKSIADFNAANDAAHNYGLIYISKGSGTYSTTAGLTLRAGQILEGQGVDTSYKDSSGTTVVVHDLANGAANTPTLSVTGGTAAVTLSTGNSIRGLNITGTGTVAGVVDSGSGAGTFSMSDVGITTSVGSGLALTHGSTGTANVTATTADGVNTINTTGGGTALNVSNATIGGGNLVFQSITAIGSSANAGIILDTTGSSGGLQVTGTGSASSGGAISARVGSDYVSNNATTHVDTVGAVSGTGVYLHNTANVSLNELALQNFTNYAVYGQNVAGFQLTNSLVTGTSGTNGDGSGGYAAESSIRFNNLSGTAAITGSTIQGGVAGNLWVVNTTGTLNRLTVDGDTVGVDGTTAPESQNVEVEAYGAGTTLNFTFGTDAGGNNIVGSYGNLLQTFTENGATSDVSIRHNLFMNTETLQSGGGGVNVRSGGGQASTVTFDISHNTWSGPTTGTTGAAAAFFVAKDDDTGVNGSMSGTINANTINAGSHGAVADPIFVRDAGGGTQTVLVSNNAITGYTDIGLHLQNNSGSSTQNVTLNANNISGAIAPNAFAALYIDNGALSSDTSTTNVVIGSATTTANQNTLHDTTGADAFDVGINNFGSGGTHLNLSLAGSGAAAGPTTNLTTLTTVINDDNVGTGNVITVDNTADSPIGAINLVNTVPALPASVPPQLALAGGVEAAAPLPAATPLTQAQLDSIVHAAIAEWAAAGADAAQVALLSAATYSVSTLPDGRLGQEFDNHVEIDASAAGRGWFVDATPDDASEFTHAAAAGDLFTDPALAPAGRYDLLTTVVHEMGHVLGLPDVSDPADTHDIMYVGLMTGERRIPLAGVDLPADTAQPLVGLVSQSFAHDLLN